MAKNRFKLDEIVLMAFMAAANAVLTSLLAFVNNAFTSLGGPILTSTIVGFYMLYGVLAIYIIRKPGAALITYSFGAFLQIMLGISYGVVSAIIAAACYAVAVEGWFALYRYRKWNTIHPVCASVLATPLWFIFAAILFGYTEYSTPVLVISLLVRFLSGIVFSGLLTPWIARQLLRAGTLRRFRISQTSEG